MVVFKFLFNQENSTLYFKFSLDDSVLDNWRCCCTPSPTDFPETEFFCIGFCNDSVANLTSTHPSKLYKVKADNWLSAPATSFSVQSGLYYFTNFPGIRLILLNLIEINRLMCSLLKNFKIILIVLKIACTKPFQNLCQWLLWFPDVYMFESLNMSFQTMLGVIVWVTIALHCSTLWWYTVNTL